jgi:maltooligosyltrehalose trehalohydrolase
MTGDGNGYYADYSGRPTVQLGRALAEGFAFQGEGFGFHGGRPRGEPSAHLPPTAFVNFLQNHDQIGNRAFGDRIAALAAPEAVRAATAVLLLAPAPPLMFMGEEWGETKPFLFFCDFHGELRDQVREGRRREFAGFPAFSDPEARGRIPDPTAAETFGSSALDPAEASGEWLEFHRRLLALRRDEIVPRLGGARAGEVLWRRERALSVAWPMGDGAVLTLVANLNAAALEGAPPRPQGRRLFSEPAGKRADGILAAWSAEWYLE